MKGSLAGLELLIPRVHKFVIFCGDELRQQTRWYISLAPSTGDASLGRHRRFVSGDYRSRALKVTPRWSAFASRGQLRSRPNCGNGANHHFLTIIDVTSLCRSRLVSGQIGAGTDPFRSAARAYLLDYDVMPGQYPTSAANLQWALVSHILLMPYSCATDMPSSQAMHGLVVLLRLHLPAISARESHCSPVVHVVG